MTLLILLLLTTVAYAQPVRSIIVCPAAQVDACNAAAREATGREADALTFSVGLVPTTRTPGDPPATAYVANWQTSPETRTRFLDALTRRGIDGNVRVRDTDHPDPQRGRPTADTVMGDEDLKRIVRDTES